MNTAAEETGSEKEWQAITVRFRKRTARALRRLAEQRDCPQVYLIRQAVEQMLGKSK